MKARRILAAVTFGTVAMAACSDGTGTGAATLRVVLTDAPSDLYASATVEIGEIRLLPADGPQVVLTTSGGTYNLLDLQNGVTADLATLEIDPGTYVQLRMIVTSASVTLADGYQFNDGTTSRELTIPSGAQTGIKINLAGADGDTDAEGIQIVPGETVLVVDFDVSQNFVLQGNPDTPAGINDVKFTPALRAVVRNVAGSIAGTVRDSTGAGLDSLVVRAVLTESALMEALQTGEASAVTDSTGGYVIRFLAPGAYSVSVDGLSAPSQTVTVGEAENVAGVDFSG